MINFAQQKGARDSRVRIDARAARMSRFVVIDPAARQMRIKPDRDTTPVNERGVILRAVTDAVQRFGGFLFHKSRLPLGCVRRYLCNKAIWPSNGWDDRAREPH